MRNLLLGRTYCKCPRRHEFQHLLSRLTKLHYKDEESIVGLINKLKEVGLYEKMCYKHVKRLSTTIGFKTRGLTYAKFYRISALMCDKSSRMKLKRLQLFKTHEKTREYFLRTKRPACLDELDPSFRFTSKTCSDADVISILRRLRGGLRRYIRMLRKSGKEIGQCDLILGLGIGGLWMILFWQRGWKRRRECVCACSITLSKGALLSIVSSNLADI